MYGDNPATPLPPFTNVPSEQEIAAYDPQVDGEACTGINFRPDLKSPPGTAWNKSITAVFVLTFVEADRFIYDYKEDIHQGFVAHFKSLRNNFKKTSLEPAEAARMKRERNRAERKCNVSVLVFAVDFILAKIRMKVISPPTGHRKESP